MGIFDDKEDVLEIELTQYGKRMLAQGKLEPAFYAFSDEDVLYDSEFAGYEENQNEAQTRILDETPRTTPQYLFYGIETEFKDDVSRLEKGERFLSQPEAARTYSSLSVLGNSQLNSNYIPAWNLQMRASEISSSVRTITGSISDQKIPQIDLKDVKYDVNFLKRLPSELTEQLEAQNFESSVLDNEIEELSDGSILEVVNEDIFIDLEELNSLFRTDNFEVEVFLVEEKTIPGDQTGHTREFLKPLYFNQRTFKRDEIYDDEEFFQEFIKEEPDETMVEYYMDIQADYEIPVDVMCKYVPIDRRRGVYGKRRNCPDTEIVITSPYKSDVDPEDVSDRCDD